MHTPLIRFRLIGICLLIAVTGLDQWSKAVLTEAAQAGILPQEVLPFFNLVLVHNYGISFGFFAQSQPWMPFALTFVTSLVALVLFIWLFLTPDLSVCLALGFIIGGALGNIYDRVRFGAVTDFLDFHLGLHHWPAFNFADSAIFIGVVILVLISIVGPAKEKENKT